MRFILIDRIDRLELGKRAEGHKLISPDEEYFRDHFPGYPLVPGVLIIESLAQLAGCLVEASVRDATGRRVLPMLAKIEHAKFLRQVRPGDRLDLAADVLAITEDVARVTAVARIAAGKAATAQILFAILDIGLESHALDDAQAAALRAWSDRIWRHLEDDRR